METGIAVPGVDALKTAVPDVVSTAQTLEVKDDASNQKAADFCNTIRVMRKLVKDTFQAAYDSTKKAHEDVKTLRNSFDNPLAIAEEGLRGRIGIYTKQENERRAKEAEAIRVAQEKELKKLEKKAEKTGVPFVPPMPAPVLPQKVQVSGMTTRTNYKAKVTDFMALVKAVAAGKVQPEALQANDSALDKLAKIQGKEGPMFPGVAVYGEIVTIGRRL